MSEAASATGARRRRGLGSWAAGWLIFAAALSVYAAAVNLAVLADGAAAAEIALPRFGPAPAALLAALATVNAAGAMMLLAGGRRAGFRLMLAAALGAWAVNLWIGVPAGKAALGLAGPAVSWALLRPRWSRLR